MKVGLLSMQRVNNYGSFWQAYCLKKMIEDKKNTVEFIDIIPGKKETRTIFKRTFSFSKIKRIPYYFFQWKKRGIFLDAQKSILGCMAKPNYSDVYDVIIIGSDEVFNFVQDSPWGFSPQLYGDMDNNNVNSYAACFGFTTLKEIEKSGVYDVMTSALLNLKHISVRDQNSADIIQHLTGSTPEMHFDPVIVGDLPLHKLSVNCSELYILVYSYDFRFSDKGIIKQIRELARKNKCRIYSVGFYQDWCDKKIVTDPVQLLNYFYNAQYIVTDTFHGTIFSVRCHKKFVTVIRDTNKQKLNDLLLKLNLVDRIVSNQDDITEIIYKDIDYSSFEILRQKERARTDVYIERCLNH